VLRFDPGACALTASVERRSSLRDDARLGAAGREPDENGALAFRGQIEFGHTTREREALADALTAIAAPASPFAGRRARRGDTYVEPVMSAEIHHLEVTASGVLPHAMSGN
jgi:ATP-dependent DNA ligase